MSTLVSAKQWQIFSYSSHFTNYKIKRKLSVYMFPISNDLPRLTWSNAEECVLVLLDRFCKSHSLFFEQKKKRTERMFRWDASGFRFACLNNAKKLAITNKLTICVCVCVCLNYIVMEWVYYHFTGLFWKMSSFCFVAWYTQLFMNRKAVYINICKYR